LAISGLDTGWLKMPFIIFLILVICGCLEGSQNAGNSVITRPPGATDLDIVKAEARTISNSDGPRGVTLFLDKMNKDGIALNAKADESSDFVDTIMSVILMDGKLNAQNITPRKYIIEYSGVYVPNTGNFEITRDQIIKIKQDAQNQGLLNAIITTMANGSFGEQMQIHGRFVRDDHYTPSKDKVDMYMHYYSEPRWRIYIS
jgi:hypothetical protein